MASSRLIDKARRRLATETGVRSNPWGGRLSVALVFPNTYHQAMSNLGFLTVYRLLNSRDDTLAERFFLPDPEDLKEHQRTKTPLFSLESGRPLSDFDLVAFSISFENDFLNLPVLFELGRLPLMRAQRNAWHPLVICGGVCAFLNPEPLADIIDLFVVGEGEVILPALLDGLLAAEGRDRPELLGRLAEVQGCYVPSAYAVESMPDGNLVAGPPLEDAPQRVRRQWLADLDSSPTGSDILTEETEFSDMYLAEVSRGCSRGCRFCAAGYIYLPPRERGLSSLTDQVETGLCQRRRIGLVGAAVSDYSQLEALNAEILNREGEISVASLRIDSLTAAEVEALKTAGHRTLALAPEAGSQRMRDLINKQLSRDQILAAVDLLGEKGILNLKLYFLIGLPGETHADIEEMVDLVVEIRDRWLAHGRSLGRIGNLLLSVNPFIPKPSTPFQWAPMAEMRVLKRTLKYLQQQIGRLPNTELHHESLRAARLQGALARGDRRFGQLLSELAAGKSLESCCADVGLDLAGMLHRQRPEKTRFPWEILDIGVSRDYLWREYRRALDGLKTPPCRPGCRRCGICH
ncbi:radical SAM protein [Geothermobacter hydrogeniphilus]|uniref:Radical SAM protein n=1 Tax=Geothermobacter hydrogeniphilus TaxID=1969733 RepID=A0A2K2H9Y3_9BACT|nr:radical SAM protein [Geothermobacter hydrogeniphilus]PNU20071.1 radical SAM protein [Geothermobacter hydrogeniphilus]